jgi:hypothetical protein
MFLHVKDKSVLNPFWNSSLSSDWEPKPRATRARAAHVPPGRTLHLVDAENLMGGPLAGQQALRAAFRSYTRLAQVKPLDHVVIGVNPALALSVMDLWPSARLVIGRGRDGADNALLATVTEVEWMASRYDRLVIGSGDHAFAFAAAAFYAVGLRVDVVARGSSLSAILAALASSISIIELGKEGLA